MILTATMIKQDNFILITMLDNQNFTMEFSMRISKTKTGNFMEFSFPWLDIRIEKGILSKSKKRIFYASLDTENRPEDRLHLKSLVDFLRKENVQVYYRKEDTDTIEEDWFSYAEAQCQNLPSPKDLGYILEVNKYGNVDAMAGVPIGWHTTSLNATQLNKLQIPWYKACLGFSPTYRDYSKPILKNIIPDDFLNEEQEYQSQLAAKKDKAKQKIAEMELTQEVIAECLYSINKEAKRKRDIHEDCIDRAYYRTSRKYKGVHYQMHRAKWEKEKLYQLKDQALSVAIRIWDLKPDGYHEFPDGKRDLYTIAGYTFHINRNESTHCLGNIEEEITAKRERSIPPAKAVKILERFIDESKGVKA